jgi:hypothetical protein
LSEIKDAYNDNQYSLQISMLAQISLTPTESKKLIAKAIANMPLVKKAAHEGMVAIHPSSSSYFIAEELTGKKPETNYWVCGLIAPRGACTEMGVMLGDYFPKENNHPGEFRNWWVIRNGRLNIGEKVQDILDQAKESDVFIKGVNALDCDGNAGILIGDPIGGGPVGYLLNAWKKTSFHWIFPAGLEKLIPVSISQASKFAKQIKYDYAMGLAAGLLPCPKGENAITVTEIDAIKMLTGADSMPIASGGIGGAEGAITIVISGDEEQVKKAIDYAEQSKGSKLPQVRLGNCKECPGKHCKFPVGDKHWVS